MNLINKLYLVAILLQVLHSSIFGAANSQMTNPNDLVVDYNEQLIKAATEGNLELVKEALAKGANIDYYNPKKSRWRPIHFAAYWDSIDIVEYLINARAQLNSSYSRTDIFKDYSILDEIIDAKFQKPLSYVQSFDVYDSYRRVDIWAKFIEYGVNAKITYFLNSFDDYIKYFYIGLPSSKHSYVNLDNFDENEAIEGYFKKVLEVYANNKPELNYWNTQLGNFLKSRARFFKNIDRENVITGNLRYVLTYLNKFLPDLKIINKLDKVNKTALMWASCRGHEGIVNALLNYGNNETYNLVKSLVLAQKHGKYEIAKAIFNNLEIRRHKLIKLLERFKNKDGVLPFALRLHIAKFVYGSI